MNYSKCNQFYLTILTLVVSLFLPISKGLTWESNSTIIPEIPLMPGTKASWIARQIEMNGLPTSIKSVRHAKPLPDVLAFYQREWTENGSVVTHRHGLWQVISTKIDEHFISLQLKQNLDSTEGMLVVTLDPKNHRTDLSTSLTLPTSFQVLAHQRHLDQVDQAETITLSSPQNVGITTSMLRTALTGAGWRVVSDTSATSLRAGHNLYFTRQGATQRARQHEWVKAFIAVDPAWSQRTLVLITRKIQ